MALKKYTTDMNTEKSQKPRIGKPYSQQAGRKVGKGAGKIVVRIDSELTPAKRNDADLWGTSVMGRMKISYKELVKKLGKPHYGVSSDDKVSCEWVFSTPAGTMTIYDYKEYGTPPENITNWHIGGKGEAVLTVAEALFPGKIRDASY